MTGVVVVGVLLPVLSPVERLAGGSRNQPFGPLPGGDNLSQMYRIQIRGARDKPEKLHYGEHPDGHDNGDDDDLVHVGEGHHDEVSIGCVIVHLYHHRDQLLLFFSRLSGLN